MSAPHTSALVFLVACAGQPPSGIPWARSVGGPGLEITTSAAAIDNGNFIIAGNTTGSFGSGTHPWFVSVTSAGNLAFQELLFDKQSATDPKVMARAGGFIVAATTYSDGAGGADFWVLAMDDNGKVLWQEAIGGAQDDIASAVSVWPSGDIWVFGTSDSFGGGDDDWLLVHLGPDGTLIEAKTYGDSDPQQASALAELPAGGLVLAGTNTVLGNADVAVVVLDPGGALHGGESYGGPGDENATAVWTSGSDLVVLATTTSYGSGGTDAWVLAMDSSDALTAQVAVGSAGEDELVALHDGFALGTTAVGAHQRMWLVGLTTSGQVLQQHTYGGAGPDIGAGIDQQQSGNLWLAGTTSSFGNTGPDFWTLLLDPTLTLAVLGAACKNAVVATHASASSLNFAVASVAPTLTPTRVSTTLTRAHEAEQIGD